MEFYKKKLSVFICTLVLSLNLIGCSNKNEVEPAETVTTETTTTITNTQPEAVNGVEANSELIEIGELTIKPNETNDVTEIIGQATNNNEMMLNFDFEVIFIDKDGVPITTEIIQVTDIKAGETKYFDGLVMDKDVSKSTHNVQFGEFFTYTK